MLAKGEKRADVHIRPWCVRPSATSYPRPRSQCLGKRGVVGYSIVNIQARPVCTPAIIVVRSVPRDPPTTQAAHVISRPRRFVLPLYADYSTPTSDSSLRDRVIARRSLSQLAVRYARPRTKARVD